MQISGIISSYTLLYSCFVHHSSSFLDENKLKARLKERTEFRNCSKFLCYRNVDT